ncbi:MAG: phosphoribosylamine--glycine ligase, partial [Thermoguttaceae bacterium]|nr:phosphoribosylamine--glycine ligase [Thermoguttaceae bacterium]
VRFGDPECQPLMMRLKTDISLIVDAVAEQRLDEIDLEWDERPACTVVMASQGYPSDYKKGFIIRGLEDAAKLPNVKVFHSGTALNSAAQVVSAGGRCLTVTALGDSLADAKYNAYEAVKLIRWEGAWCRKDIADKGIRAQQ